jgi:hypothetical protein
VLRSHWIPYIVSRCSKTIQTLDSACRLTNITAKHECCIKHNRFRLCTDTDTGIEDINTSLKTRTDAKTNCWYSPLLFFATPFASIGFQMLVALAVWQKRSSAATAGASLPLTQNTQVYVTLSHVRPQLRDFTPPISSTLAMLWASFFS